MPADEDPPARFIVRIVGPDGSTAGVGALVGSGQLVTCAHVINTALGLDPRNQRQPTLPVTVEFPLLPGSGGAEPPRCTASVQRWWPPPRPDTAGDDIAGLALAGDQLPARAGPARLAVTAPRPGQQMRVFGYPGNPPRPAGAWVPTAVRGRVGGGLLQLDSGVEAALRVQPGYSGSPVIDDAGRVVGLLAQAAPGRTADRDSYAIGTDRLRLAWPEVLDRQPATRTDRLSVLHLSDLQIGPRYLFGGNGLVPADQAYHTLVTRLHADLAGLADQHDLRPDLVVVTGGLAEAGLRTELEQAFRFLAELAEAVELPRHRVAIVPGNHDVNRRACEGYFATEEADERRPVPPYFPKWRQFAAAFDDFYAEVPGAAFSPEEPWSLFEIPDLAVVVAGLNSTMAESHRDEDHYGWLGQAQLHWFAERLTHYRGQGWLRLAAVHHHVAAGAGSDAENLRDAGDLDRILGATGLVNLVLHGHGGDGRSHRLPSGVVALSTGSAAAEPDARPAEVPNQYQLLTIAPAGFTRHGRRYAPEQHRWIGDRRITGTDWRVRQPYPVAVPATFAPPDGSRPAPSPDRDPPEAGDDLLALVVEATRVSHPDATVTTRRRDGYLRVSNPLPDGVGVDLWPVGVVDAAAAADLGAAIDRFVARVHAPFAAANPAVRSQLVYAGPRAPDQLVRTTRAQGVRLRSFVDYQGLLDLHPLVAQQTAQLAADRLYPPALYIPQRYRLVRSRGDSPAEPALAEQVVTWLRAAEARFVMVLGDFGRGKTALLRHLARTLPAALPDLLPILVELRSLEKAPSLDELLVQHLVRREVEDIDVAKLRYMIRTGQLVLLFDGFDELELRVGYDHAADYLATLLAPVTSGTRAKVVLTSRTQHFRATSQVTSALGDRVAAVAASRIVELTDFSEDQIRQFLTSRYGGDQAAAQARFALLTEIEDLLGLARNPRMLEFIAALPEARLREVRRRQGRISAAELYRELIETWLQGEADRQRHRYGVPSLDERERLAACIELAKRLWAATRPTIPESELSGAVSATLTRLAERGYTAEQAAHSVGSGSLLVRTEDGTFTFVHQSVMEWLVAFAAATELREYGGGDLLGERALSPLMVDFLCDLAGRPAAHGWAAGVLTQPDAPQVAKRNALAVSQRFSGDLWFRRTAEPPRKDLAGVDLRQHDLAGTDLRGANLRRAVLRDMRLTEIDLSGADLREADLTGVRMVGGSLRDARLDGSRWDRAALLGVDGTDGLAGRPELAAAAIPGRDPAAPQLPASGPAGCVAFSPDGALLAVGRGSTVELVDRAGNRPIRTLTGHARAVTAVVFSPDGALVATASDDETARIWDLASGAPLTTLTGHGSAVTGVAFSPDGAQVATASRDRTARLWDAGAGRLRTTLTGHTHPVTAVAFAPGGDRIATASRDNTARIWDLTGACQATLNGHRRPVTSVAFSPDGGHLATASHDETARIWDAGSGAPLTTLTGHTDWVTAVAYVPGGDRLATASHDGSVRIWYAASGTQLFAIADHAGAVTTLAVAPDGGHLATTAADDGIDRLWDAVTGDPVLTLAGHTGSVRAVVFSPDSTQLATTYRLAADIWEAVTGRRSATIAGHLDRVNAIAYSPDGSQLATASRDGTVKLRSASTGRSGNVLTGHRGWVNAVTYSPDGSKLATASSDRTVRLWDVATGQLDTILTGHLDWVHGVAFCPDGTRIATASRDGTVRLWHAGTGQERATLIGHTAGVRAVAYTPAGARLATASDDRTARLWCAADGTQLATLIGHDDVVTGVAFSPSGGQLATISDDGTVRLWKATGLRQDVLSGHAGPVTGVAYSPDGTMLATASEDGTVRLWDPHTALHLATLIALPDNGYAVLLPDGTYKLHGEPRDTLWWAVKLCRFAPGELDPYVPAINRVPDEHPTRPE